MEAVSAAPASVEDALSHLQAGRKDEALPLIQALVRSNPSDGHVHALMGICQAQHGDLESAVKSLETAALLNPNDPAVEYNLAHALFQVGRKDQARWRLTRLLENDPENQDAKLLLAHLQQSPPPAPPAAVPNPATVAPAVAAQVVSSPAQSQRTPTGVLGRPFDGQRVEPLAPPLPLRLMRGAGWGALYAQIWTVFSLFWIFLASLMTTRLEVAIIAFVVMSAFVAGFHGMMGALTGIVAALMNADEDMGGWIGMSVGLLILLIGVASGFLAFWAVFLYLFMGRWIGRSVAVLVQKPIPG
jgi:hypothetical protein